MGWRQSPIFYFKIHFQNQNVFIKIGVRVGFFIILKHFWDNFQNKKKRDFILSFYVLSIWHFSSLLFIHVLFNKVSILSVVDVEITFEGLSLIVVRESFVRTIYLFLTVKLGVSSAWLDFLLKVDQHGAPPEWRIPPQQLQVKKSQTMVAKLLISWPHFRCMWFCVQKMCDFVKGKLCNTLTTNHTRKKDPKIMQI